MVPIQTYYSINFGLSFLYNTILHRVLKHTLLNNQLIVESVNPLICFISAFSAPYFIISFVLDCILRVIKLGVSFAIIPPWDEFRLDDNNMEFKRYKFVIYYQMYFIVMIVFVSFLWWNLF